MKPTINRPGKPGSRPPATRTTGGAGAPRPGVRAASAQAFFTGVVAEMKRVTWPTREEWMTATVLTIGLVVVVGLYTALCDHIFGWVIGLITGSNQR